MEETIRSMQMMANKYMDDFEEDLGSVPEGLRPLRREAVLARRLREQR